METKTAIGISITHELLTAIDRRVAELRVKDPTLRMNRSSFVRAAVRKALRDRLRMG